MRLLSFITALILVTSFGNMGYAQNKITVRGVVKDQAQQTLLAGVSISTAKPQKTIAATDSKGAFTVLVDAGSELVFTYAGYTPIRKTFLSSVSGVEISISPNNNSMQEVVVQGFKTKTRETSTGSSLVLSGKALQDVPVSNVMELLQGKVAGLNIQNNSGSPGGMGTINIRGLSGSTVSADGFLTPTSPLFVIDGVPVDMNSNFEYGFQGGGAGISPLSLIPPEDIEQMDVLKDAAATSQYGARAAYGVIIVTTKRGKSKVPIVQYSTNVFVKTPPKLRETIGGKEERAFRINSILQYDTSYQHALSLINSTPFLSDSLNPYYNNATNWQDYFFRNTYNQQHNMSIRGGDDKFNYKTNLNYYQENGIIQNTGFKRYSLSMNALYAPSQQFRMTVNLSSSLGQKKNGSGVGLVQTGVASSANSSSLLPPPSLFSDNNSALATANVVNNNKTINISSSWDMQYEPVKGVRFGNLLSYNLVTGSSDRFTPSYLSGGTSEAYSSNDRNYTIYDRTMLSLTKTLNRVHNLSGYVFNEINATSFRPNVIQLSQTASDQITGPIGYSWANTLGGTLNSLNETRQHGYGGSFSYNYDRKYVLDFNFRLDGLSTTGAKQPYSNNPSVSARWNFGKEKWMEKYDWLSYGSLKASWGRNIKPTGNIFDTYGRYNVGLPYNNNPTVSIDYGTIPNEHFLPETQTQSNVGIETGLFGDMVNFTMEGYYRSVDNQVMGIDLSNTSGFSKMNTNAKSIVNYGMEWTTTVRVFKPTNPFKWTVSANGSMNRDILAKLPDGLRQITQTISDGGSNVPIVYRLGRNVFSNLLYYTQGVYANTENVPVNMATGLRQALSTTSGYLSFQAGDPRWTDVNGDYIIDEKDLLPIGNPVPRFVGGFASQMEYKRFQLNMNWSFTLDRDLLNASFAQMMQNFAKPATMSALVPIDKYNYWKPTVPGEKLGGGTVNARYPNPFDFLRAEQLQPYRSNQTLFLEDGSYWKLNNVVLIYNVDRKMLTRLHMTSCKLTLTANNVLTISKYTGPDPEMVTQLGRDNSGGYPNARSYAAGINVQF
ncbi:SusC/RagA family TonB-linked outer membrane protein [Chitinophagaceae bacterium LB-8]|uniref:SusC/RagA family TonB-linked outer membrane protein n=1 Tax=Paraflavisolibacter caeni TaxID=2982496 RepID=A0A9X3BFQ4_9BACT|nr:SusC/RagA family TonB-linked outer membrane protein [Paraflavisolibacter caeni]MCU7549414.1 SusC/RagA family TonB-linked outer membrane protein [Paraflavisolibacter caeni]